MDKGHLGDQGGHASWGFSVYERHTVAGQLKVLAIFRSGRAGPLRPRTCSSLLRASRSNGCTRDIGGAGGGMPASRSVQQRWGRGV